MIGKELPRSTRLLTFVSALVVSSITACVSYDSSQLDNLSGDIRVIGHAGSGFASWIPFNPYPSNSYTSLIQALDEGIDGVEVDLHMTSDKDYILYHDNELDSKTDHSGCPVDYKLEELNQIRYKLGFPFDWFQSEKLIGLEDLVLDLKKRGAIHELHLDFRHHSTCHGHQWDERWEQLMVSQLHYKIKSLDYPADKIYLISVSRDALLRAIELELPYHLNYEVMENVEEDVEWALANNIQSITIKKALLSPEITEELHAKGIEVITFGAKSKRGNKSLLELNPDVIQTDNVKALKELLDR